METQPDGMANPFIGVRIPRELAEALDARLKQTGQSKSDLVIDALRAYLGLTPCHTRLEDLEHRLAVLEKSTQDVAAMLHDYKQGKLSTTHSEQLPDATESSTAAPSGCSE